jgi:hypothetical protein
LKVLLRDDAATIPVVFAFFLLRQPACNSATSTTTSYRNIIPAMSTHVGSPTRLQAVLLFCLHLVNFFLDGKTGLAPPDLQYIDNQLITKQLPPNPFVFKRVGSTPFHKYLISRPLKNTPSPTLKSRARTGSGKYLCLYM